MLERRHAAFDRYLEERMPVLVDFCQRLEFAEPHRVLIDPELFLCPLDAWLAQQNIDHSDDRLWLATRVGYYVGELFVHRFHGCWFVEDNPDARYFPNYVVGRFSHFPNARVDPNLSAMQLLAQPPGRSLRTLIDDISSELVELASDDHNRRRTNG